MNQTWKRLLALLAVLSLVAAACGGSDATTDTDEGTEDGGSETETTEAAAPAGDPDFNVGLTYDIGGRGDQSFNDSAAAGIDKAQKELNISFTEVEPNADGSDRSAILQTQADGSELVIAVGFLFEGDAAAVAAENPDVNFAVVDSAMLNFEAEGGPAPLADNAAGLTFAENEGSFLVGVAAALKSENNHVGFIGGVSGFGLIEKFQAGFTAGAMAVNPDIEVTVQYISEFPDFAGFGSPDRAKEIASAMYDGGADVVYHAAGGSGAGLFEAARDTSEASGSKVWAIGVDSDQYLTADASAQEYILTSMLKRVDVAVYEITKAQQDGTFSAGNVVYDLSVDGVGYATSGGNIDDIVDQLEDYKAQIIAGDIVVPTEP